MDEKVDSKKSFQDNPLFLEVMAEALAIQNRFAAEPIYARTGKGFLKSAGVEELQSLKNARKTESEKAP
ncbi:MAG: hypothetical protein ACRCXD_15830 [Luteolibacter sp.]